MKKFALLSVFVSLLITTVASSAGTSTANWPPQIVFYGGDFDPNNPNANGLANENDAIVPSPVLNPVVGAATYQNFVYNAAECWPSGCYITGLFTNNLSRLNPTSAYWEIRAGVSEGNGGTIIASGTASGQGAFSHTPTGRSGFGFNEYKDEVSSLYITVDPDIPYWFAVVPNDPNNFDRSFNSNTFGLNSVGTQIDNEQFWNSAFFGANFTNANNEGVYPTFSSGVLDNLVLDNSIPEPSSLVLLGTGLMSAAVAARRRFS